MEFNLADFKENYLFSKLTDEEIQRVVELATVKDAVGGTVFIEMGAGDHDIYVVLKGTAMVYRMGGVLLGERGPGSVIGEIALIDSRPRSAYVVAKAYMIYARFDGNRLRQFMIDNKEIGFTLLSNLARVLSARLREASEKVEDLEYKLAEKWPKTD